MEIKSNNMLKIVVPIIVFIGIFVCIKSCKSDKSSENIEQNTITQIPDLQADELKALGVEGDTSKDTIQTFVTILKNVKGELNEVKQLNETLIKENSEYKQKEIESNARIENILVQQENKIAERLEKNQNNIFDQFQNQLNKISSNKNSLNPSSSPTAKQYQIGNKESEELEMVTWVNPIDAQAIQGGFSFPSDFRDNNVSQARKKYVTQVTGRKDLNNDKVAEPVYTLPENSTLMGAVSMTALLGRVPINGTVSDPYPFKVLIGKDNLVANGIELNNVEGAIMSGKATGDWTLSCVRGEVQSMTFVFSDGRVRTIPEPSKNTSATTSSNSIGWISDVYGIPCVSGERKSNASEYISSQFLLSASSAAAKSFSNSQTTTVVDGSNVVSAVTGNNGKYVLGQALSGGLSETSDWFKERYGQMFDAIYVPPGQKIAIHITKQLEIDYELEGRKVDYTFKMKQGRLD